MSGVQVPPPLPVSHAQSRPGDGVRAKLWAARSGVPAWRTDLESTASSTRGLQATALRANKAAMESTEPRSAYDVVIVGAGHAGAQAAINLRQGKFTGSIALLGDERAPPYERPPLSKEYLAGEKPFDRILLRPEAFWAERDIAFHAGARVASVDALDHRLRLANDREIGFGKLNLGGGGQPPNAQLSRRAGGQYPRDPPQARCRPDPRAAGRSAAHRHRRRRLYRAGSCCCDAQARQACDSPGGARPGAFARCRTDPLALL